MADVEPGGVLDNQRREWKELKTKQKDWTYIRCLMKDNDFFPKLKTTIGVLLENQRKL